jgi:hypothetical protein
MAPPRRSWGTRIKGIRIYMLTAVRIPAEIFNPSRLPKHAVEKRIIHCWKSIPLTSRIKLATRINVNDWIADKANRKLIFERR